MPSGSDVPREERIRWAAKVPRAKIRQLYRADALGVVDGELIADVGEALYARCQSILLLTDGSFLCPCCAAVIVVGWGRPEDADIPCPAEGCGWTTTNRAYHNSWRRQDLLGGNIRGPMEVFMAGYDRSRNPRERMRLIDGLIHAFHQDLAGNATKSAATNLIDGKRKRVEAFLDELAYGPGSTPGLAETREKWEELAEASRSMASPSISSRCWSRTWPRSKPSSLHTDVCCWPSREPALLAPRVCTGSEGTLARSSVCTSGPSFAEEGSGAPC